MKKNKSEVCPGNRFNNGKFADSKADVQWAEIVADEVIEKFPNLEEYTCAAGISPSGMVHFGNMRDVMTAYAVALALKNKGKKVKLIFSWDDFDRLRKVPSGYPEGISKDVGKPLTDIPDLLESLSSYAEYYEKVFESTMKELGVNLEYRYQTKEYLSGRYCEEIDLAVKNRIKIAEILYSNMTDIGIKEKGIIKEDYVNNFYPVSVYSSFTGKDSTKVLSYENYDLTYQCLETGNIETVNIKNLNTKVKLSWKIDWPMRWKVENVVFEPGGHDHATPGGSYDVSAQIAREIFNIVPPVFVGYQFIGIQGSVGKMSGSKGNAISPGELLEIYEPQLLKWLYLRRNPHQVFELSFGDEIIRQYDEFDTTIKKLKSRELKNKDILSLKWAFDGLSSITLEGYEPVSFRQISGFGQIVNWSEEKINFILEKNQISFEPYVMGVRLGKARVWLDKYNSEKKVTLLSLKNIEYYQALNREDVEHINKLADYLKVTPDLDIEELEKTLYAIPKIENLTQKENSVLQRKFFTHIYNLLIGKDTGPRLATYIWAINKTTAISLIDIGVR
jgi:lysyl-tRNA synthetase class 1